MKRELRKAVASCLVDLQEDFGYETSLGFAGSSEPDDCVAEAVAFKDGTRQSVSFYADGIVAVCGDFAQFTAKELAQIIVTANTVKAACGAEKGKPRKRTVGEVLDEFFPGDECVELHGVGKEARKCGCGRYMAFFYDRECAIKEFGGCEAVDWTGKENNPNTSYMDPVIVFRLPEGKEEGK